MSEGIACSESVEIQERFKFGLCFLDGSRPHLERKVDLLESVAQFEV